MESDTESETIFSATIGVVHPDRPMLMFVSDIHLTDQLPGASVDRADTFDRFWTRIQAARGKRPAHLCFVGDLFDLVRAPRWFDGPHRPYHEPGREVIGVVDAIVDGILDREAPFFDRIRGRVTAGELEVTYVLGNHDRLLAEAPAARRKIWRALTGRDENVEFPNERLFPEHGVLAFHGNVADAINFDPDGGATIGDAIGSELITRFPAAVGRLVGPEHHARLGDIDDVRPVYAVPAWVRQVGAQHPELLRPAAQTWTELVDSFLSRSFVKTWMRGQHKRFGIDTGKKLRLLLELSTSRIVVRGSDKRLTDVYRVIQHAFDGKMATHAASRIDPKAKVTYVVNGHSHFASMAPLGDVEGKPAVYFNTGTWRRVHQIGHDLTGRPTFLAYDAMSYLVFFSQGDPLGRDYEWWTGAMVSARDAH